MKIYGKEHDFYDCALAHGQDPLCVWNREFKKYTNIYQENILGIDEVFDTGWSYRDHDTSKLMRPSYFHYYGDLSGYTGYIFFCGKTYPLFHLESKDKVFYSLESLEKYLYENYSNKDVDDFLYSSLSWRKHNHDKLEEFFNQDYDCEHLHRIKNISVYIVSNNALYEGGPLKDFQFQKIIDPYTCLQEINMYISGVLGGHSPNLVEISDIDKIEGKGFDKVTSFRNMKRK